MLDSTYSNENDMLTANPCLKQISNLMVYLVKALELGIAKQIFRAHVITYFHHISDFRFFEPVLNRIFRSFGIYLEKRIFFLWLIIPALKAVWVSGRPNDRIAS